MNVETVSKLAKKEERLFCHHEAGREIFVSSILSTKLKNINI